MPEPATTGRDPRPVPLPSARRSVRSLGLLVAAIVLVVLVVLSITIGSVPVSMRSPIDALFDFDAAVDDHLIVRTMRLPRTVVGLLAGAALGLAGAVMQGLARNPLADPGILGVNAGAALFVVCGISVFGMTTVTGYVWFGFAGAASAALLVYRISAMGHDGATPLVVPIGRHHSSPPAGHAARSAESMMGKRAQ